MQREHISKRRAAFSVGIAKVPVFLTMTANALPTLYSVPYAIGMTFLCILVLSSFSIYNNNNIYQVLALLGDLI